MRFIIGVVLLAASGLAQAQLAVVSSCGSATYSAGQSKPGTQTTTGDQCVDTSGGGGGSTTANQGTAAADSGSWPVHLVFGTTALSLGQALMAASIPVVISSNQSAIHALIDGANPLPVTQSTSPWVTNDPGIPDSLGQKTSANSTGVVISSDQSAVPISGTITPTPASAVAPVVGGSAVSSLVLKASAGSLFGVYATCTSACWLMVFNAISAPSNGATTAGIASGNLQECIAIPSGQSASISYGGLPPSTFSVGITAAISSTACATLTLATTGFIHGTAQ